MADNVFSHTPLENALRRQREARQARSVAMPAPTPAATAPTAAPARSVPIPGAASAAPQPAGSPFEAAAVRFNVPVNVIEALGEVAGIAPEHASDFATRAGEMLAAPLSQGMSMKDAVASLWPNGAPEGATDAILARAVQIADERYPAAAAPQEAPPAPKRGLGQALLDPRTYLDPFGSTEQLAKGAVRGVIGSVGAGARAVGAEETAAALTDAAANPALAPSVGSYKDVTGPVSAGQYLGSLLGESAPEMGAVIAAGVGGAAVGGPAGGFAAALGTSTLFNAGRNLQRQEQESPGATPSALRAYGTGLAQAGLDTLVPGRIGGFGLVERLMGAADRALVKVGKEVAEDTAIEAATETAQQLMEIGQANPDLLRVMVAPRTPEEAQRQDQLLSEIVESAIGGGAAGAGFSGGAAAMRAARGERPAEEALPLAAAPAPAAPEPAGPLERALQAAPAALAPDLNPGDAVTIQTADGGTMEGVFVSEDATGSGGVRVRVEGQDAVIPREELEAGEVVLAPAGAPPSASAESTPNYSDPIPDEAQAPAPQEEQAAPTAGVEPIPPAGPIEASEPPVPTGFVRMYHGTPGAGAEDANSGGGRWFSSGRTYARDYRGGGDAGLWYVDVPRSDPMFDDGETGYGVDQGKTVNVEFDPSLYGGAKRAVPQPEPAPEPAPAPEAGPVSQAAMDAIVPTEAVPAEPAAPEGIEALQQRLAYVMDQGRTNGWNRRTAKMRADLDAQIAALQPAAEAAAAPEEIIEPSVAAPAAEVVPAAPPVAAEEGGADDAGQPAPPEPAPMVEPEPPLPEATPDVDPTPPAAEPVIDNIREKAAVLRVAEGQLPPALNDLGISLKWDRREGGYIFSRAHVDRVRAALNGSGATPEPVAAPGPVEPKPAPSMLSDAMKAEMRAIAEEADRAAGVSGRADADRSAGPDVGIPVGSVGERGAQKQEAMMAVLRGVRRGMSPTEAADRAKAEIRDVIARHNARRKADANWQVNPAAYDALIERTAKRLSAADAPADPAPGETIGAMQRRMRAEGATTAEVVAATRAKGAAQEADPEHAKTVEEAFAAASPKAKREAREAEERKKPLYAYRQAQATTRRNLREWARRQGFESIVADPHITVAFSREKVDPKAVPEADDFLDFDLKGVMPVKLGAAIVLPVTDDGRLEAGWQRYRDAGASWDFDSYKPHITITYQPGDVDISKVEPFTGKISIGPEVQEDLDPDAASKVKEIPTEGSAEKAAREAREAREINAKMREDRAREKAEQALRDSVAPLVLKGGTARAVHAFQPFEVSTPAYTGSRHLLLERGTIPAMDVYADQNSAGINPEAAAKIVAGVRKGQEPEPIEWLFAVRENEARSGAPEKWRQVVAIGRAGDQPVGLNPLYLDFLQRHGLEPRWVGDEASLAIVNKRGEIVGVASAMRANDERRLRQMEIAAEKGLAAAPAEKVDKPAPSSDSVASAPSQPEEAAPDAPASNSAKTETPDAGARWDAMSEAEREGFVRAGGWVRQKDGGLSPLGRSIAKRAWSEQSEAAQRILSDRMAVKTQVATPEPAPADASMPEGWSIAVDQQFSDGWRIVLMRPKELPVTGTGATRDAAIAKAIAEITRPRGGGDPKIFEKIEALDDDDPAPAKDRSAKASPSTPRGKAEKIDDFGEHLAGARKDKAAEYAATLETAKTLDVAAEPLSKSWPAPDYEALIAGGADPWVVSFIRTARDMIPTKPSAAWKLKGWVSQVTMLRNFADRLLRGDVSPETLKAEIGTGNRLANDLYGVIDLYEAVGHSKSLKGLKLSSASYSMRNGVRYNPNRVVWEVQAQAKATAFSNMPRVLAEGDTKEEALERFKAIYPSLEGKTKTAAKEVRFDIYSRDKRATWIIGKKIPGDAIDLKTFPTIAEARAYLGEHHDDLVAQLDKMRDVPSERRATNSPRVGIDHRNGGDVTPEQFADAFGFRGVQFGNWVEGERRQADLNETYDALMDLAGIIGVPARALSLNGELGLAFGARGSGGKNAAAAHYEPGTVVINLTKKQGAGSLAHEWFHGLDSYFSRSRGKPLEFITDRPNPLLTREGRAENDVRDAVLDAFGAVRKAIAGTEMKARNQRLDKLRSKPYWATGIEMHARAFESYVIAKLEDQGASNDYLANLVNGTAWAALAKMQGIEGDTYPYLHPAEIPAVRAAFDALFNAIETRETDRGIAMFSLAPREADGRFAALEQTAEPGSPSADGSVPAPAASFTSAQALGHHLTNHPEFGPWVAKMVEGGRLVLHDDESTLPSEGRESSDKDGDIWRRGLDRVFDKDKPAPAVSLIRIGRTAPVYRALGLPNLPWVFRAGKIRRVMAEHPEIDRGLMNRLPALLADPDYVFRSATEEGRIVSVVAKLPDGRHIIAAIEPEGQNFDGASAAVVTSLYGKDDPDWLNLQIQRKRTLYAKNGIEPGLVANISRSDSGQRSPQGASTNAPGSARKILTRADLVKKSEAEDAERAPIQGVTTPDGTIHLVASNLNSRTAVPVLLHEAFHSGTEALIGEKAMAGLLNRLDMALRAAKARAAGNDRSSPSEAWWDAALRRLPPGSDAEELGAYAIEQREAAPAGIREIVDNIVGRVQAWLLRRFGRQFGAVTPGQLRALAVGALRTAGGPRSAPGLRYSTAAAAPSEAQMDAAERGLLGHALTNAMAGKNGWNLLALAPGRAIFTELADGIPAAAGYLRTKEEMDALRHQWHVKFDETAQAWRKLLKGADSRPLMDLMHDATLAGLDPSKPMPKAKATEDADARRAEYHALRARYEALAPAYKAMFNRVRDDYRALDDEMQATLLANIEKAMDRGLREAERAFKAEQQRIADEGLRGDEWHEAMRKNEARRAQATRRAGWGKRAKMADLRKEFESQKVPEPYFPLARFGQFFVTARDSDGKVVHFSRHESAGVTPWIKAQRAVGLETAPTQAETKAELERQGLTVETGTLGETAYRDMVDPAFVTDVEGILADAGVPEAVKDQIWQRWLETLPDMSIRKSRIHRKGTPGYDTDAFRAYGHHMFHGSHQLARLKFAMDLDEDLNLAETQAQKASDPVRAGLVVEEMRRRNDFVMNPKGSVWAQSLSSAAFLYHLSFSPAAAMVNLTQTSILGPAILGAYQGGARGIGVASRQLWRALVDFGDGRGHALTSGRLSQEEKDALAEAYRRGIVESTQSHDLAGISEQGVQYSDLRTKWMSRAAFFFHHAERMNREVTFLAAFRMAKAKGLGYAPAVEKAGDLTWKVHFDNQASSKPRFMQNDLGKVAFIFRNFSVNMLWRLFRDAGQALKGATPEERAEAMTQLGGITAMMALHAGVRGVWGYSLVMMIAGLAMGGDDDDAEQALERGMVAAIGPQLASVVMNGVPGYLTGTDLTNRIGMPDLWFRGQDRQLEGEAERFAWWSELLGAGFGMLDTLWRGLQMVEDGQTMRGIETMLPKAFRDILRAGRFLSEGAATSTRGDVITETGVTDAAKQILGFTPAELAKQYRANNRAANLQARILDERAGIMDEAWKHARKGEALPADLIDRIVRFSQAVPEKAITGDNLQQSFKSRQRSSQNSVGGVWLDPKLAPRIQSEVSPPV